MSQPPPLIGRASRGGAEQPFDIRTARALGKSSRPSRVAFAIIYGLMSLSVLPPQTVALWLAVVVVWELASSPAMDLAVERLTVDQAMWLFAACNAIGSSIFGAFALMCLASGSAIGVGLAATWLGGTFMNQLIYFGANRRVLWSCLIPSVAITLVGPFLGHAPGPAALISAAILASTLASRNYALDHRAVVRQLADRQITLVEMERRLSVAVEASGDGMFESDLLADELHVNPSWLAMVGYTPDEIEPTISEWRAFIHPDDLPILRRECLAHFEGETPHTTAELRLLCKDGTYKWVLTRARLVSRTPDGRPARMVGTTIDISSVKALEHQLEAARDLAESGNRAKSVFVTNMSHEIRTPLNGVIGIAGALARTELSQDQREMVELVQSSGQMLERILSDILDEAKIDAGSFELQIAPLDLCQEVQIAMDLMRARVEEKGLQLRLDCGPAARGVFDGDAMRLRQIVSNLASNAIKFTPAGVVSIKVDAVGAPQADEPALIRIEVSDSGIGFDEETAARLFNRFVQADGSISRKFGGTGLGLSICKSLSELMGGRISARSQPGVGSTFTVEIPLMRAQEADHYPAQHSSGKGAGPTVRMANARILLVEDHPTNQRVVQLILGPVCAELTTVDNGQEAVEAFWPGRFDLILMDMQMPVMDGLAATRAIRDLERRAGAKHTPIAMFTANAMGEHRAQAIDAGANQHISKPITAERLLAGVEMALRNAGFDDLAGEVELFG